MVAIEKCGGCQKPVQHADSLRDLDGSFHVCSTGQGWTMKHPYSHKCSDYEGFSTDPYTCKRCGEKVYLKDSIDSVTGNRMSRPHWNEPAEDSCEKCDADDTRPSDSGMQVMVQELSKPVKRAGTPAITGPLAIPGTIKVQPVLHDAYRAEGDLFYCQVCCDCSRYDDWYTHFMNSDQLDMLHRDFIKDHMLKLVYNGMNSNLWVENSGLAWPVVHGKPAEKIKSFSELSFPGKFTIVITSFFMLCYIIAGVLASFGVIR